jgi:hypothetical protein
MNRLLGIGQIKLIIRMMEWESDCFSVAQSGVIDFENGHIAFYTDYGVRSFGVFGF